MVAINAKVIYRFEVVFFLRDFFETSGLPEKVISVFKDCLMLLSVVFYFDNVIVSGVLWQDFLTGPYFIMHTAFGRENLNLKR